MNRGRVASSASIIHAASVAVFREGRVLLGQRRYAPWRGCWSLPGGRIGAHESSFAAAVRELYEETGVVATLIRLNQQLDLVSENGAGGVVYRIDSYVAAWRSNEPQPSSELSNCIWVSLEEAAGLPLTPGLLHILSQAKIIWDESL